MLDPKTNEITESKQREKSDKCKKSKNAAILKHYQTAMTKTKQHIRPIDAVERWSTELCERLVSSKFSWHRPKWRSREEFLSAKNTPRRCDDRRLPPQQPHSSSLYRRKPRESKKLSKVEGSAGSGVTFRSRQ